MALNLTPEAKALISEYQRRECLPSMASAVNRLILLTLGKPQGQPVAQPASIPQQPVVQTAQPQPQAPAFSGLSNFKI
jgi:hypothetical protein